MRRGAAGWRAQAKTKGLRDRILDDMSTTTQEQWQLERASAEAYERYAVASWSGPLAARLVALAAPQEGERVLDVACGTGIVARLAAEAVGARGAVAGVDLNEGMVAIAREQAPAVDWRQGDVEALPAADGAFDLVACQQGLQFFGRRAVALAEMRRALAPGGRLALSVMRPIAHNAGWGALADALGRHAGPEAGAMMRAPFPDWDGAELRELVTSAGFEDVRVLIVVEGARYPSPAELVRWEAEASPLAGPLSALSAETRAALVADVEAAIADRVDDDGVLLAQETYVVLARR
jgi:ubiquinone/menaquinone biosynthesis C-methylase UbiE